MSTVEKAQVLARVASSSVPKREVLSELGVPRSTYYRWRRGGEGRGGSNCQSRDRSRQKITG